jgi:hypothetical protein
LVDCSALVIGNPEEKINAVSISLFFLFDLETSIVNNESKSREKAKDWCDHKKHVAADS